LRKLAIGPSENKAFINLLTRMLKLDPRNRISPEGIINHPFCSLTPDSQVNTFWFDAEDEEYGLCN